MMDDVSLNFVAIHTGIWRVEGGMRRRKMRTYNKKNSHISEFLYICTNRNYEGNV